MIVSDERILFGTWLRGEHLEDIQLINIEEIQDKTLFKLLKSGKNLIQIGTETNRIVELVEMTSTTLTAEYMYQPALMGMLQDQCYHAIAGMKDIEQIQKEIDKFRRLKQTDLKAAADLGAIGAQAIERRLHQESIRWIGLPTLQNLTHGIKRGELTALAARPSVGKSAVSLQIARGAAEQGVRVSYFPLEMSAEQTVLRLLCQRNYLTSKEAATGKAADTNLLTEGFRWASGLKNFNMFEGVSNLASIERIIDRDRPYLVVIDQLSQLRADRTFTSFREQFSYMTSNLKRMALQYNVAILLLCQINRGGASEPTMANLKESGSIEEDSDNVILLHRIEPEDTGCPGMFTASERAILITLAKQRDGEIGAFISAFNPENFAFYEKEKYNGYD